MLHFVFPMNRPFKIFYPVLDANVDLTARQSDSLMTRDMK